jgi:phage protein D
VSASTVVGMDLYPLITVDGQELSQQIREELAELRVETELCLPGKVTMRFHDANAKLAQDGTFALGSSVQVKMPAGGSVLIDAIITGVGFDGVIGNESVVRKDGSRAVVSEVVVTAYDKSILFARTCTIKGYLERTASDIVDEIASAHGLTASSDTTPSVKVATVASNDLQTITALADQVGLDWWVSPGNELHFKKPAKTVTATLALGTDSLRSFSAYLSGLVPETVDVRGFLADGTAVRETSTLSNASTWPESSQGLVGKAVDQRSKILGSTPKVITSRPGLASAEEGATIAAAMAGRLAAAGTLARGHGDGNENIKVGSSVKVTGTTAVDGTYHVTKVTHIVRRNGFETRFVAGDRRPNGVVDMLGRTEPTTTMPMLREGLVVGTVTALGDDGHKGLVKVKIPGLDDDLELIWGRFVVPGGGGDNGRGLVVLPEIGDDVLVGFEHGDVHRPIVIGGLYRTGKQGDWDVQAGKVVKRRLITRAGHVFSIGDGTAKPDNNFLFQLSDKTAVMSIAADKVELTTTALPVKVTDGTATVELDGSGNVSIKGVKVTIEAQTDLELHGLNVTIKADTKLSVSGLSGEVNTTGQLNVNGGGMLGLKGGMVQIN